MDSPLDVAVVSQEEAILDEEETAPTSSLKLLGAKTITFLGAFVLQQRAGGSLFVHRDLTSAACHCPGGVSLIINNVTGPGMVDIPVVFVTAGWFPGEQPKPFRIARLLTPPPAQLCCS
jgi:hypothetical protein